LDAARPATRDCGLSFALTSPTAFSALEIAADVAYAFAPCKRHATQFSRIRRCPLGQCVLAALIAEKLTPAGCFPYSCRVQGARDCSTLDFCKDGRASFPSASRRRTHRRACESGRPNAPITLRVLWPFHSQHPDGPTAIRRCHLAGSLLTECDMIPMSPGLLRWPRRAPPAQLPLSRSPSDASRYEHSDIAPTFKKNLRNTWNFSHREPLLPQPVPRTAPQT